MLRFHRVLLIAVLTSGAIANLCGASLGGLLASHGYAEARLQRRFGNHLFLSTAVNGRRGALLLDTSAPRSVIHRASAATFGIALSSELTRRSGVFGEAVNEFGRGSLSTLRIGDRMLTDIPVVIADQAARVDPPEFLPITKLKPNAKRKDLHLYARIDPVDGLLGSDILRQSAAIVDCGHQIMYLAPRQQSGATAALAEFLADRGFARVPMRITREGEYEVVATINGHPTRLIVDTGSSFTLLGRQVAAAAGVFFAPIRFAYVTGGNHLEPLSGGTVKQLAIGSFQMENTGVNIANISGAVLHSGVENEANSGLLGIDQLSMNFAVIDFGSSTLYLRHPDRR
jgi:predicted aspartyl protease